MIYTLQYDSHNELTCCCPRNLEAMPDVSSKHQTRPIFDIDNISMEKIDSFCIYIYIYISAYINVMSSYIFLERILLCFLGKYTNSDFGGC